LGAIPSAQGTQQPVGAPGGAAAPAAPITAAAGGQPQFLPGVIGGTAAQAPLEDAEAKDITRNDPAYMYAANANRAAPQGIDALRWRQTPSDVACGPTSTMRASGA
jgi:hypothetical protein